MTTTPAMVNLFLKMVGVRMYRRIRCLLLTITLASAVVVILLNWNLQGNDGMTYRERQDLDYRASLVADINVLDIGQLNQQLNLLQNHLQSEKFQNVWNFNASSTYDGTNSTESCSCNMKREVPKCETIHVTLVCAGHKDIRDVVTLIKSILFYRNNPLHFHFITDEMGYLIIETLFKTWDVTRVKVSLYLAEIYLNDVSWILDNQNSELLFGLTKLIIPKIMPTHLDKTIILDTDVILSTDIAELWRIFSEFTSKKAIGIVSESNDWDPSNIDNTSHISGSTFNTEVILVDMKKLRDINWAHMWKITAEKEHMKQPIQLTYKDIINAVIKKYPYLVHTLPFSWNFQFGENANSEPSCTNTTDCSYINVIHWNSSKEIHEKSRHFDFFYNLYFTFLEYNGNRLREKMFGCSDDTAQTTPDLQLDEDDLCYEFRREASLSYRTHLYFIEFQYTPKSGGNDITFVTHLSMDRIRMIEALCKHWEGPISLALYVTEIEAQRFLKYVLSSKVLMGRKDIGYHVVYKNGISYPINFLRNVALKHATTPYVFLSDIDFLPMNGMYQYQRSAIDILNMKSRRRALVIPAFETRHFRLPIPESKAGLLDMLKTGEVFPFRSDIFPQGHAATNFDKWTVATVPYKVQHQPRFEPYVVVKKDCPTYDLRFVGFGWNKVSHILELHAQGYDFIVLPNAFIIHTAHARSFDNQNFLSVKLYRECHDILEKEFGIDMIKKYGFKWQQPS